MEAWRIYLYLPLGSLPALFFASRMLIQWIQSEKQKKSFVSPLFWKLSLTGNLLLFLHHVIQVQYPFALFQSVNALISWRNLNFQTSTQPCKRRTVLLLALAALLVTTALFFIQSYWLIGEIDWIRSPQKLWDGARHYHSLAWHLIGTVGGILFASRFWLQWWQAEQSRRSELGKGFWILSIMGSLLLFFYALKIGDLIIALYNCFGLIPYIRNLFFLLRKPKPS